MMNTVAPRNISPFAEEELGMSPEPKFICPTCAFHNFGKWTQNLVKCECGHKVFSLVIGLIE